MKDVSETIMDFINIQTAVQEFVGGDIMKMIEWMDTPTFLLDNKTPSEMVLAGKVETVLELVRHLKEH